MDARSPVLAMTGMAAGQEAARALQAFARLFRLEHGLYALRIEPMESADAAGGWMQPCIQLTSPPSTELDVVDIMSAWSDQGAWVGAQGGTVVVRVMPGGGQVLATLYGGEQADASVLDTISVLQIDKPAVSAGAPNTFPEPELEADPVAEAEDEAEIEPPARIVPPNEPGALDVEVTLHVQRLGDAVFDGAAWCGSIGQRLQLEAFGLRGLHPETNLVFEYMAFGPAGRQTRWIGDGDLCGTRGRGMPLTGFAVRLAPHLGEQFDVSYQGAFFDSGVTLPSQNGEPCLPALSDDCLEAMQVRVTRRQQ